MLSGSVSSRRGRSRSVVGIAVGAIAVAMAGCSPGTTKSGTPAAAGTATGQVRLRFASGEPQLYDVTFGRALAALSGGRVTLETVRYDVHSTTIDAAIAKDLRGGKLDVADVASRAWLTQGVDGFTPYQAPFLVTSRSLLDQVVRAPVAGNAVKSLDSIGVTGLAVVPLSIRYVFSTRPLRGPKDFAGVTIRLNADPLGSDVFTALGAKVDSTTASGVSTVAALRVGTLTAVEADVHTANVNGYLAVAPYVLTGAPLYAKTATFAASAARLKRIGPEATGWIRRAAEQAAAEAPRDLSDRNAWASACAAGAKPVVVSPTELDGLRAAEEGIYRRLSAHPDSTLTFERIGRLAAQLTRHDPWTRCGGRDPGSTTGPLDGRYTVHVTPAQVQAGGDCLICGNDGDYTVAVRDGRYAILHPTPKDADPQEPSVAFISSWGREDPIEIGSIVITGDRALFRPDCILQFIPGSDATAIYSFAAFRGALRWTAISGSTWEVFTANAWARVD